MVRRIIHITFLISFLLVMQAISQDVRPAVKAGQFYPSSARELYNQIEIYLDQANVKPVYEPIRGIWVPHAGYMFSGQIAGNAYAYLKDLDYDAVIVIAPSHYVQLKGAAIGDWKAFETPLGNIEVDINLSKKILNTSGFVIKNAKAHLYEHAVEVQLPFIQTVLPRTPIVPIVTGDLAYADTEQLARDIVKAVGNKNVLLVASSDMSHYPSYMDAYKVDLKVIDAVSVYDTRKVYSLSDDLLKENVRGLDCVLCGKTALTTVMLASKMLGARNVFPLPYTNSGDISGERQRVVGYGAALFIEEGSMIEKQSSLKSEDTPLTDEDIQKLFTIARESILAALNKESLPNYTIHSENLKLKRGVFVTLTNNNRLRGCIGNFQQSAPLARMVQEMAVAAATQDYRFSYNPVTSKEMFDIDIKISILSELKKVNSPDAVEVGKHGIWIKQGGHSGTYLPEVATEMNWTREEFLTHCCVEKAGLSPTAWKESADIYVYTSLILDEKDL